jgi:hypothetical protein
MMLNGGVINPTHTTSPPCSRVQRWKVAYASGASTSVLQMPKMRLYRASSRRSKGLAASTKECTSSCARSFIVKMLRRAGTEETRSRRVLLNVLSGW